MALIPTQTQFDILSFLEANRTAEAFAHVRSIVGPVITEREICSLHQRLHPLIGLPIDILKIPEEMLGAFEPSQIGTIVGTLVDACIPQLDKILPDKNLVDSIGLKKHEGILGEREGYPDYKTSDGYRLELKLLYVDPTDIYMKSPPTPREASARLTQKVTLKNIDPEKDLLLVLAYQFQGHKDGSRSYVPTITDVGLFPVIDCVLARDCRLYLSGGRWFGHFETPTIISRKGKANNAANIPLDYESYGRKESEGKDFNEDTNFGKLKRIPHRELQMFLKKCSSSYSSTGHYPSNWRISQ